MEDSTYIYRLRKTFGLTSNYTSEEIRAFEEELLRQKKQQEKPLIKEHFHMGWRIPGIGKIPPIKYETPSEMRGREAAEGQQLLEKLRIYYGLPLEDDKYLNDKHAQSLSRDDADETIDLSQESKRNFVIAKIIDMLKLRKLLRTNGKEDKTK